jgi:hypothetical protein
MKLLSVIIFSLFTLIQTVNAQQGSPYTRFGLGDIQNTYSARRLGMGQLGTSVADEDFIGTLNPAGWSALNMTRIEFGVAYNGFYVQDASQKKFYGATRLSGFTLAFPVSNLYGIGVAMGIIPVTDVNYELTDHVSDPNPLIGNYDINYKGSGGLSKIFIGTSYRLPFDLSLGATFDYYFGTINYSSSVNFTGSNNIGTDYTWAYKPKATGTTLGLISPDLLKGSSSMISDLRIGASVNLIFSTSTDSLLTSSSAIRTDTINFSTLDMKLPYRINVGASFKLNKSFLISLDYAFQPWKDFSINNVNSDFLRNMMMFSAGFEYRAPRDRGSSYFNYIIFRGGLSYEQTQYFINNVGINQYSVYGGASIPLSVGNTIDIGLQYSFRGQIENSLLKENGLKLAVGISLGDIWFLREEK